MDDYSVDDDEIRSLVFWGDAMLVLVGDARIWKKTYPDCGCSLGEKLFIYCGKDCV